MEPAADSSGPNKAESILVLVAKLAISMFVACMVVALCWGLIGVGMAWQFNRPPFSLDLLERLDGTMTTEDVRKVLGAPGSTWVEKNAEERDYETWAYSRRGSWPIVYIYFTPDGKFSKSEYDY
jgi:hypothetical protein